MSEADSVSRKPRLGQLLPVFVAAQRKHFTASSDSPHYENSQLWTAGRCQRLMRPITSRIESLRKDPIRYTATRTTNPIEGRKAGATVPNNASSESPREFGEENTCWPRGQKRVRRTYSVRSNLQGVSHADGILRNPKNHQEETLRRKSKLQPGEFLVATPFISRTRSLVGDLSLIAPLGSNIVKHPPSRHDDKDGEAYFEGAKTMRRIKKSTNAARFKVYEEIYNSMEALFKATTVYEEQALLSTRNTGRRQTSTSTSTSEFPRSRSLFSMCLRAVPYYIKEKEKRVALKAEELDQKSEFDTREISTETYADLESLGTSETGWKHLKTVVLVHGVLVVSDAIEEGLLDADITSALVMLCVHTSLPDQAETLLTSLLKVFVYPEPKSPQSSFHDNTFLLPLLTLEKYAKHTGRLSYYHRQIKNAITSGSLSVKWLGTRHFSPIWTSLFRSLSIDPHDQDALTFMTSVIPILCGAQPSIGKYEESRLDQDSMLSVLETTLASVLTTLLAMSILRVSDRNISKIFKTTILDCQLISSGLRSHGATLIAVANFLGDVQVDEDASFLGELVKFLGSQRCQFLNSSQLQDRISSFLCSVARCAGRGSSGDSFEHLRLIIERLMVFAAMEESEGARVLGHIVVDSAFAFAGHCPRPQYVQYAQHIMATVPWLYIQPKTSPRRCEGRSESGFRWEEGINEWVMVTPLRLKEFHEKGVSSADEGYDYTNRNRPSQKHYKPEIALQLKQRARSRRYSRISDHASDCLNVYPEGIRPPAGKDDLIHDESLQTGHSLQRLQRPRRPISCRRSVTKTRRRGCELRRTNQNWILFDHSDDELNLTAEINSDAGRDVFRESPNSRRCRRNMPQRTVPAFNKTREPQGGFLEAQSEDELGL